MEIEVGEYVRTKYGEIGIVTKNYPQLKWKKKINPSSLNFNLIKKHSKNIIDLIEIGDYVNGYRVYHIAGHYISVESFEKYDLCFEEQDIKSIVTKEQFASMEYKVEKVEE